MDDKLLKLGKIADQCVEGTTVLSLTNPVQNVGFEVLVKGTVTTSWGEAEYYLQEKLTPAKNG